MYLWNKQKQFAARGSFDVTPLEWRLKNLRVFYTLESHQLCWSAWLAKETLRNDVKVRENVFLWHNVTLKSKAVLQKKPNDSQIKWSSEKHV